MHLLSPHASPDGGDLLPSNRFTPRSMLGAATPIARCWAICTHRRLRILSPPKGRTRIGRLLWALGWGSRPLSRWTERLFLGSLTWYCSVSKRFFLSFFLILLGSIPAQGRLSTSIASIIHGSLVCHILRPAFGREVVVVVVISVPLL